MSKDKRLYSARRAPPVINAWDAFEPEADTPCLFAHGFTLIDEYPEAPHYPHLILAPALGTSESPHFGVGLYLTPHASRHVLRHPSEDRDVGQLVDTLAEHLASARFTSDILEVKTETPLRIYVVDPTWRPVAERFVAEYGRPINGDLSSK